MGTLFYTPVMASLTSTPCPGSAGLSRTEPTANILSLDPFRTWPRARPWIWAVLALWVGIFQGPTFIRSLRPARDNGVDFFQEWASARNLFEGLPIYGNLGDAVQRHLGLAVGSSDQAGVRVVVEVNAHPPTSVLLTAPFALLDYPDAVLAWNLVSLALLVPTVWMISRALGYRFVWWHALPLITLLLLCNPLRQQVYLGQFNLVLLFLLTAAWAADRSERPWLAGALLGTATAVKLFPGFLFLYFALSRRWRTVAAGLITLAALTAGTALVTGAAVYREYFQDVLPQVERSQSGWTNVSLMGFWKKLFDPATALEHVEPLWRSPLIARVGAMLSGLVVVLVLARVVRRGRTRPLQDWAYGLALTAMLLVSPICWDHYFIMLLLPLALLASNLPTSSGLRVLFAVVVAVLWLNPELSYDLFIPGGHANGIATPFLTLTVLALPTYALASLFVLITLQASAVQREGEGAGGLHFASETLASEIAAKDVCCAAEAPNGRA